ncbi:hypothetical protein ABI59_22685 [Acidobacteria bacterium Mor1]|nr:hypothetical protein ABI59_22685 [Acidobacteria bacterium Mor1]
MSVNPFVDCDYSVSNGNPGSIPSAVDELLDCLEAEFLLPQNSAFTFFQNGDNSAATPINFRVQYNDTFFGPQIIPGINVSESDPDLDIIEITVHEFQDPTRLYVSIPHFAEVPDATGDDVIVAFRSNSGAEQEIKVQTIAGTNMLPLIERDLITAGYNVTLDTSGLTVEDMPVTDSNGNVTYVPITRFRMELLNPAMITTDIMFELRPQSNGGGGGGGGR